MALALIGVLIAIVVPTMGQLREISQRNACASNMRQAGIAIIAYTQDHNGGLPGCEEIAEDSGKWYGLNGNAGPKWWVRGGIPTHDLVSQLMKYFGIPIPNSTTSGLTMMMVCPSNKATKDAYAKKDSVPSYYIGTTARLTTNVLGRPIAKAGTRSNNLNQIASPKNAVALFDVDNEFLKLLGSSASSSLPATSVHGSVRNVLYFDGHVSPVQKDIDPHEKL